MNSTAQQQDNFGRRTLKTRSANKQHQATPTVNGDVSSNDAVVAGTVGERLLNVANSAGLSKVKRPRKRIRKAAQFTLKQSRSLVYVAIKYMVDNFGGVLQVRSQMSEDAWEDVARDLNTLPGKQKPAKQWAKSFVSKKHFISCKFVDYVKRQRLQNGDNFEVDWGLFTYFDLLLLQEYRIRGYPNMPCVGKLIKAIKEKKLHLGGGKILFPPYSDLSKFTCDSNNPDDADCMLLYEMGSANVRMDLSLEENYEPDAQPGIDSNEPLIMPKWVTAKKSIYLPYLAYLVAKFKVKIYGLYISKICNGFDLASWQIISDHFESNLGIKKSAKGWRKNYWAHQYTVQRRFIRRIEEEEKETGPQPIDWSKVSVGDLLFMQNMRIKGHENMPGINVVMQSYEKNEKYISFDQIECENMNGLTPATSTAHQNESSITLQNDFYVNETTLQNNPAHTAIRNDFGMTIPSIYDTGNIEIKTEGCYDFTVEELNYDRPEMCPENNDTNNFRINVIDNSALVEQNTPQAGSLHNNSQTRYHNLYKEEENHPNISHPLVTHDQYNHNSRLLEIKEKILKAKLKKNKILRRKNKILKEHTKLFGQLLTKLDVLIEKKT